MTVRLDRDFINFPIQLTHILVFIPNHKRLAVI